MKKRYFEPCGMYDMRSHPPERKTAKSAGYDFHVPEMVTIEPGQTVVIPTGYRVKLEDDEWLALFIRSSLGIKRNLILSNCVGVIDADYYGNPSNGGEIMGALTNIGTATVTLATGEAFMQGIIMKYDKTDDDETAGERTGGIGSTSV